MKTKQLPRLWCALQGLLPLEAGRPLRRGQWAPEAFTPERAAQVPGNGDQYPPSPVGSANWHCDEVRKGRR